VNDRAKRGSTALDEVLDYSTARTVRQDDLKKARC